MECVEGCTEWEYTEDKLTLLIYEAKKPLV
jgi:hypothetical protein